MWSDGAVDTGDHCRGKDGFKVPAKRELVAAPAPGGLARALAESQACRHACTHTPPMSSESFATEALSYVVELQGVNTCLLLFSKPKFNSVFTKQKIDVI